MSQVKRMLMAEQWDTFARMVLPPDCAPIPRQEMRRAFYAGGQGILHSVMLCLSSDADATEGDLNMMANLERELSDFAEAVKAARA